VEVVEDGEKIEKTWELGIKGRKQLKRKCGHFMFRQNDKMSFDNELIRKLIPKQNLVGSENFSKLLEY